MLRARIEARRSSLGDRTERLRAAPNRALEREKQRVNTLGKRLAAASPARRLAEARRGTVPLGPKLQNAICVYLARRRDRLNEADRLRNSLGYTETLRRGFAVVRAGERVITTRGAAAGEAALEIEFADGRLPVNAGQTPRRRKPGAARQGSLFDD